MPQKFDPENKQVLISSQRREQLDIFRVMSLVPLLDDHVIADVGCGPGYFTVPLGKSVFNGKVIALDVQQEMLDAAEEEVARSRLGNVEFRLSQEASLPLDDASVDGALIAFVFQEAEERAKLMGEIRRVVKKGGWVAVLEWHRHETDHGPPLEQRIEEDEMRELAAAATLRFSARYSLNNDQYMLLLQG